MGVAEDFAPSFVKKPQLRQEDDGNRLIFECQLLSSPRPSIEWYRSDTLLVEDARTKFKIQPISDNKFSVVLDLDDVVETDAGLYKVKAKNKLGEVSASINLNFSRKYKNSVYYSIYLYIVKARTEKKPSAGLNILCNSIVNIETWILTGIKYMKVKFRFNVFSIIKNIYQKYSRNQTGNFNASKTIIVSLAFIPLLLLSVPIELK